MAKNNNVQRFQIRKIRWLGIINGYKFIIIQLSLYISYGNFIIFDNIIYIKFYVDIKTSTNVINSYDNKWYNNIFSNIFPN